MAVTSTTPEGLSNRCLICGQVTDVEPSSDTRDAPCASCGQLLWWFKERLADRYEIPAERVAATASFFELGADSLDLVEFVMEMEEEFDLKFSDRDVEGVQTVGDAIRLVEQRRRAG